MRECCIESLTLDDGTPPSLPRPPPSVPPLSPSFYPSFLLCCSLVVVGGAVAARCAAKFLVDDHVGEWQANRHASGLNGGAGGYPAAGGHEYFPMNRHESI